MTKLITEDDVYALELERVSPKTRDARLRDRVARFVEWATGDEYELEEGLTRSYLLSAAASHLISLGDLDEAERLAGLIARQPDAEPFEGTVIEMEVRLARGERDAAIALADEVRRARTDQWNLAEEIGELFEAFDELQLAERWFTIGARQIEAADASDFTYSVMLTARYRVRRAAGKPEDALDEEAIALRLGLGLGMPARFDDE